ncbi:hypothetical protein, partial [Helicobacter sp. UBA3407]|uniref:hypothetical protein n=1 Tax=Helicobacter sp. UBA3407 TaxID=1946588 RepID=UPI00262A9939
WICAVWVNLLCANAHCENFANFLAMTTNQHVMSQPRHCEEYAKQMTQWDPFVPSYELPRFGSMQNLAKANPKKMEVLALR